MTTQSSFFAATTYDVKYGDTTGAMAYPNSDVQAQKYGKFIYVETDVSGTQEESYDLKYSLYKSEGFTLPQTTAIVSDSSISTDTGFDCSSVQHDFVATIVAPAPYDPNYFTMSDKNPATSEYSMNYDYVLSHNGTLTAAQQA